MHCNLTSISPEPKMSLKLAILGCFVAFVHAVPQRIPRIAGGVDAKPGQFPYYVSLYLKDSIEYFPISPCGGTILNNQWILTAAYCLISGVEPEDIIIKAGNIFYNKSSETEQTSEVIAAYIHPKYDIPTGPYDIALFKLKKPLEFNEYVSPIDLPQAETIPTGVGTVTGLGSLKNMLHVRMPDTLQTVTLPIIDNDECQKVINDQLGEIAAELNLLDETRFCTGATKSNQGYCLHDSGDPIAIKENGKNVLIGVATFGFAADCETPGAPSIYTRVSAYNEWIQEIIRRN